MIFIFNKFFLFINKQMFIFLKPLFHNIFGYFKSFFQEIVNLIFPNLCLICDRELLTVEQHICSFCTMEIHMIYFDPSTRENPLDKLFWGRVNVHTTFALFNFEKGTHEQKILHQLKYGFKAQFGIQLGKWMGTDWLQKNQHLKIDAFIPVPIHPRKKFNRGYNQSEQLANGIASILKVPVDCNFIRKSKNTNSQTKKSIFHRRLNVENVFKLSNNWRQYKHIVIVDDVVTTGATLEAMISIINKRYPALEISIFVLAMAK